MNVGLIGFGRLGKLIAKYLSQDFHLYIYDPIEQEKEIKALNAYPADFESVCQQSIIIPAVPMSEFEGVIKKMAPHLQKETLIADVCSVKIHPVDVMKKYLPEHTYILGTHPMFGPDSASDTLFGAKLVLSNIRMPDSLYSKIKIYFEKHGIKVIESTPDQHDKDISSSLFLTHLIGRTLLKFQAQPLEIDTKGYRRLMKILLTVENDSWQLFQDMYEYNPYAQKIPQKLSSDLSAVLERLSI